MDTPHERGKCPVAPGARKDGIEGDPEYLHWRSETGFGQSDNVKFFIELPYTIKKTISCYL